MFSFENIKNLNVWMIKIIIFIIPFLPLYISSSMPFPFITVKNFAFRILVELAAALWIGLIALNKEYRIRNSPIVLSVLTFTFIVGLADLTGMDPYRSFWSNYERMEGYVTILHLALYFMILISVFKTKKDWKIFFTIILLVSVCVSLFPFVFTFNKDMFSFKRLMVEYGTREFSLIGNPPFLAAYLLMSSFIGLILIFNTQKTYLRFGCLMVVLLNCVVIYLTATRGAILSAIAGVIILISAYIFRRSNTSRFRVLKRTVLLLLVMSIIMSGIFLVFSDSELARHNQTLSRFTSMLSSKSVKSRIDVWGMAWNAIKERPVLGWGQDNLIGIYTINPIALSESPVWMDRAHNIVIEWLINAGILGMSSYLAMFGTAFYVLRRARRQKALSQNETVMILTALLVYFFQNLFSFDTINTYIIYFALLAYINNLETSGKKVHAESEKSIDSKKINIISVSATLAALLCFSLIFYYINYKPMRQARQFMGISSFSLNNTSYSRILKEFNNALSFNTFGDSDVRRNMRALSYLIVKARYFDQEGALKFVQAAIDESRKEIALRSYDLELMTDGIMFFNQIAEYDKSFIANSEALIKKSMNINPEYYWLYMVMADVNIMKKDYESAYSVIKNIADLDPGNEKKQFKLALTAIYSSREEAVAQALENVKKIRTSNDKNIISERKSFLALAELYQLAKVYRETKQYEIAIKYLDEIIRIMTEEKKYFEQDADYYRPKLKGQKMAQIHAEIAWIYFKLNDRENALKEIDKIVEIDPDYARKLIDSINN